MRTSLDKLDQMKQDEKMEWHIKLLKEQGDSALRVIRQQIPDGETYISYVNKLKAKIEADN